MKHFIALLMGILFFAETGLAQHRVVEKQFRVDANQKVKLDLKFGERILIKSWDRDEVAFKADIEVNNGKLNDALDIDFDQEDGTLHIRSDYDKDKLEGGRSEDCPKSSYSKYSWSGNGDHYVVCSTIVYELSVPADVDLEVESISGDIELVNLTGPVRAKSISGYIDLSWPTGRPATIDMKTISGEAFTDIDELELLNKKDQIPLVGYKLNARIGGGGPRVSLESISGNVYLRKSQS